MARLLSLVVVFVSILLFTVHPARAEQTTISSGASKRLTALFSASVDSFRVCFIDCDFKKSHFWKDAAFRAVSDSDTYYAYKAVESYLRIADGSIAGLGHDINTVIDHFFSHSDTFGIKILSTAYSAMGNYMLVTDYDRAVGYYEMAETLSDGIGDDLFASYNILLKSEAYRRADRFVEGALYSRKLLEMDCCKKPSTMRFLAQAQLYKIYSQMRANSQVEYYGKIIEKEGFYLNSLTLEGRYLLRKADYLLTSGRYEEAYECSVRLQQTCELTGTGMEIWRVHLQAAKILATLGRYSEAMRHVELCKKGEFYIQGYKFTSIYSSFHVDLVEAYINVGLGKYKNAKDILDRSNPPAQILQYYDYAGLYYRCLETIYSNLGDYKNAVKMVDASNKLREVSFATHANMRAQDLDNIYRSDTTIINQDAMLMRKNIDVSSAQMRVALWIMAAILLGMVLVMLRLLVIRYRRRKEQVRDIEHREYLEREVGRQTRELLEQKNEISRRNNDIIMSQSYARVIQEGVLPDPSELNYPEIKGSFIIYKPVDVVSGDFYWFRRFDSHIVICCADCSGRGVPGAMMTMVGLTLLNDITSSRKTFVASELMGDLDIALLNMMPDIRRSDSIDVTIAVIDLVAHKIDISSANQDFVVGIGDEMKCFSGVRRHVGFASMKSGVEPFCDEVFDYRPGDTLYLFTDGVPSLSGGVTGESLGSGRLLDILSSCKDVDVENRAGSINKMLSEWCLGNEPTDDYSIVCVEL